MLCGSNKINFVNLFPAMGTQGKTRLIWDQNKDAMFSSISECHKGNGAPNSLAIHESGA